MSTEREDRWFENLAHPGSSRGKPALYWTRNNHSLPRFGLLPASRSDTTRSSHRSLHRYFFTQKEHKRTFPSRCIELARYDDLCSSGGKRLFVARHLSRYRFRCSSGAYQSRVLEAHSPQ